jgi:hypothetical protein
MEPKAKPTPKQGERNLYCPFYNDCLDYAINNCWRYWNCSQCPHKRMQSTAEWEYEVNDEGLYYDLSPDIARGYKANEID